MTPVAAGNYDAQWVRREDFESERKRADKAEAQLATALQLTTQASIEHLQSSYQASACFKHRCGLAIPK